MTQAALLFDLDGTLAITDPIHERAWRSLLAEHDVELAPDGYLTRIAGRANPAIVADLLPQLTPADASALIDRKEALFREHASTLVSPKGLAELIAEAQAADYALAVVTNAPRANALHVLTVLGLRGAFSVVVGSEDVSAAKPDPQPFLLGLKLVGANKANTLAFEDSPSGIGSAAAAGLPVVGLLTGHPATSLIAAGATALAENFEAASIRALLPHRRA